MNATVPKKEQHHEQHDRRDRVANRPGGNVFHDLPAAIKTGLTVSPSCRNAPARRDDLVLGIEALGNGHSARHHAGDAYRSTLNLALRIDDEHVAALVVAEHGGLRQHGALGVADRHLGARERARAQIRIRRQRDLGGAETRRRINDGAQQPNAALINLRHPGESHVHELTHLEQRQILFGHLAAQLRLAILG